ncbi:TetR/AcrR family transcriptional regulator [Pseudarthrobacter sp. J1738]|uniref:TetR/AcrR family transcriptional regulator n=1 Tax=unclassified Pseudarthrobacter TaxID=2647000 RepID=UPI003D2D2D91
MPKISASSNVAQRAETQRRILTAFGELLFTHGLPGLTMTDVARHAGVGRTAVYNYYADMEQLLISYALDETEKFITELRADLNAVANPVGKLAVYIRAQVEDLTRRHLPPGPAMGAVLSPGSFAKLADHVSDLNLLLQEILQDGIDQGFLPESDVTATAQLIHGTLASSASRGKASEPGSPDLERHIESTVRFIQHGAGAMFDAEGNPMVIAAPDAVAEKPAAEKAVVESAA